MRKKRARIITIQWILPLIVLFITIVVILIVFSVSSQNKAREQVERNLISIAESYSMKVNGIMSGIAETQKIIADMMIIGGFESNNSYTQEVVDGIEDLSDVYLAVYCKTDGRAVISRQARGDLSEASYFSQLHGEQPYCFYTEDDGITGQSAIISVCPVTDRDVVGYLLVYYNPEKFGELIENKVFDLNAFHILVDSEGKVMGNYGSAGNTGLVDKDNFWESQRSYMKSGSTVEMVKMRIKMLSSGVFYAQKDKEERTFVFAPAGVQDWFWVIGIKKSYVVSQEEQIWKSAGNTLICLSIAVFIFLGTITVLNVVTKIRTNELSKNLENKADTDLLTELNNKVATECKIKEYIRDNPDKLAIMFVLDIDNFKKINDTMGHAFGDEVLRTLGHRMRAEFRVTDIIGRSGGDEFTILMKDIKDDSVIEKEGKRVERFFQSFEAGEYVKYSATASIGVAVFPSDAKDFESLYKAADRALYIAKKRGKNQLAFYDKDVHE